MGKTAVFDTLTAGDKVRGFAFAFAVRAFLTVLVFASAVAHGAGAIDHFHVGISADRTDAVFFGVGIAIVGVIKMEFMLFALWAGPFLWHKPLCFAFLARIKDLFAVLFYDLVFFTFAQRAINHHSDFFRTTAFLTYILFLFCHFSSSSPTCRSRVTGPRLRCYLKSNNIMIF